MHVHRILQLCSPLVARVPPVCRRLRPLHRRTNVTDRYDARTSIDAPLLGDVTWRKSTASNPSGDCVELAALAGGAVALRNSREPNGPALIYTPAEITAFLAGAKAGEFDDLAR
jgi:hypothetical protein